jgi:ArsR family transcriptional regulator, arsenate/arsenite/antimonite-responsive transcriptional repressor
VARNLGMDVEREVAHHGLPHLLFATRPPDGPGSVRGAEIARGLAAAGRAAFGTAIRAAIPHEATSSRIDGRRYLDGRIDGCQYEGMRLIQHIEPDCCPPFLDDPLAPEEAENLAGAMRVVADPARLRLLSLIASRPGQEACGCDLTAPLGLSQPTVSHHLKVLHEAGLLEREQRGRWAFYRLNPEPLRILREALQPREPALT